MIGELRQRLTHRGETSVERQRASGWITSDSFENGDVCSRGRRGIEVYLQEGPDEDANAVLIDLTWTPLCPLLW